MTQIADNIFIDSDDKKCSSALPSEFIWTVWGNKTDRINATSPVSCRHNLNDDEEVWLQLANSDASAAPRRCHIRPVDGGEGQLGARDGLHVQSWRVRVLHLLEERGKGECGPCYASVNHRLSSSQEGDVIELCQVSDIRAGGLPKDMKLCNQLINRHGDQLEEKSLTICSGTDYININYQHVICPSAEIAKVRAAPGLFIYVIRRRGEMDSDGIASVDEWIGMLWLRSPTDEAFLCTSDWSD